MGAAAQLDITGSKGGESKPKTPVEAPDSLRSTNLAKILLAVGEGEFDSDPTDRDIYLDNTPIMDASGNVNFPGVKWEWRRGTVEQDYIQGIPAVENETTVNVELRSDNPFTRALSNTQLSAVRVRMSWPRLAQQDSEGNTNGYRIEYAIDIATDGGAYIEANRGAVDGKSTTGYQRSVRVNLPAASSGWMMRVRRLTPNANSGTIGDTMTIAGYTEIIDQKIRYPNTALLYIEFDAQQFQNIPAVTVKCKAKRWPVPSNYDPATRTYTGVWDGTFKQAWTNNPVWATYGICVNDRFGLGKRIQPWMVDKWEMYRIGQYCDQLVPDGVGGQEPRYLCDLNLQGKAEAWTLLRDLSAIYRGMTYWAQGSLFMQADMPRAQDIDYVFTRSNVIDGDFVYGGAGRDTHYSRALVSYDNPANNYDTDVVPVTDKALQRRYRDRPIEISAIACTRASEAQRRGKWALLSNDQDRTVTFKTGMEGANVLPGFVIPVADELVAGRPNGGRISAAAGRVVTLDRDTPIKPGDRLIINLPNGTAQGRTVQSVSGRAVTVTTAYALQPEAELQWAIDYEDLAIQLFRVLKRVRTAEGEFEFTALEFNPSKFPAIDTGAKLDERPISVIQVTTVPAPASVSVTSGHAIDQGIAVSTMTIAWPAVEGAVGYDIEWRKDNGNWVRLQRVGTTSVDVVGIYAGAYLARVRATSAFDITSTWRNSVLTELKGKVGAPASVTFLTASSELFAIRLNWGIPADATDTQRTEIWRNSINDLDTASKLTDLAYPQSEYVLSGLSGGAAFFFWARLVDRSGNIGPFFPVPPTAVRGMASTNPDPILDIIGGEIDESLLGEDLKQKIGKIDDLQKQIDALDGLKAYNKDSAYTKGQMAVVGGRIYQAKSAIPADASGANSPPNAALWDDVGQSIEAANGLAQQVSTNKTDIQNLDGEITATAESMQALRASYRDDDDEGQLAGALQQWNATAAFAAEVKATATREAALAQRTETLQASLNSTNAAVQTVSRAQANLESVVAQKTDTLSTSIGQTNAAVQTVSKAQASLENKASTVWAVKMELNAQKQYVAAGIGLGIENGPAGLQSQFLVSADRFSVVNNINDTLTTPFTVQGGQVFIRQALIGKGWITNAMIGDTIQSDDFVEGQRGWRIQKSGAIEINGTGASGERLTINNRSVNTYYANGQVATKMGINI